MTSQRIIQGDCIESMRTLPDASVHCCVTSPPYWGLRDYGHDGQIGLESTPDAYVARMVEVFREVRRVLRDDGTLWLNLGDTYNNFRVSMNGQTVHGGEQRDKPPGRRAVDRKLKEKDLVGIPWRVAFALQADGWWLRQDIIWHKPNPMPESVRDRCTKAHEYVFLLTKSERYFYDSQAVSEPLAQSSIGRAERKQRLIDRAGVGTIGKQVAGGVDASHGYAGLALARNGKTGYDLESGNRNRRSVWEIATKPYSGAHFAVMHSDLVEPCIKAGCPEGGIVFDPFAGSGTTLAVAAELGRSAIGCELNPDYIALAERRIKDARASVALFEGVPA
jgi:DNA modification methylase